MSVRPGTSPTLANSHNRLQFSENSSDIKELLMSSNIYDRYSMDWYTKFARFGVIDPYNALTTTKEYIFITKPDLCLMTSSGKVNPPLANRPFFVDAVNRYPNIIKQLQSSISMNDGPFMNVLSNSITSSLDIPGISAESVETGTNIMGTKISYRGTSYKSDEDLDFNLEFEDTKYLDIYMLFKIYDEYEKIKWEGGIDYTKASSNRWTNYIINKVLHDQVSIYKFVVAEDGYRIVYWARIVGCYPNSVPRDAFSDMNNHDQPKLTVGWRGHFIRDMDPVIITHFNHLVANRVNGKKELPLFNVKNHRAEGRWASTPYIDIRTVTDSKRGTRREYYLRWAV